MGLHLGHCKEPQYVFLPQSRHSETSLNHVATTDGSFLKKPAGLGVKLLCLAPVPFLHGVHLDSATPLHHDVTQTLLGGVCATDPRLLQGHNPIW